MLPPPRLSEPRKFIPVAFIWGVFSFLYCVYVFQHCLPRLQYDVELDHVDTVIRARGQLEFVAIHVLIAMISLCYFRAMFTNPGNIPSDDGNWGPQASSIPSFLMESKKTGERRHCRWCDKYKPDRAHHCRVCATCVLRMDHHCPWIYNCVGFFNYKYFFLLLFYSMWACQLIAWTMIETVSMVIEVETPFLIMFTIIFAETLACILGLLVTLFFLFHVWLVINALTTIEFCEKTMSKKGANPKPAKASPYNRGSVYKNVSAALGDNVLTWLLPLDPQSGDGIRYDKADFATEGYRDMDASSVGSGKSGLGSLWKSLWCTQALEGQVDEGCEDLEATKLVTPRKTQSACGDMMQTIRCDLPHPPAARELYDVRFGTGLLQPATSSTIAAEAGDYRD